MKRTIAPTTLVIAFATVFVLGVLPWLRLMSTEDARTPAYAAASDLPAQERISLSRLLSPALSLEIGRQTFDGRGNTDATATLSANGNIVRVTVQGTYAVNPDCTGSMTLYVSPFGATALLDFVIDDDGAELRAIITDAGAIESLVFKKQFPRGPKE